MKYVVLMLVLMVLLCGCEDTITGEMLRDANDQWLKTYTADRRMTAAEATEYAALDDAGKIAWRTEGKPTDRPMSSRSLDATMDFYRGTKANADAAIKKNE
jgi:hypothetical protein